MVSSNALPNIDTFALWIPHPALCVHGPVEIELPDTSGIADKTWHGGWLDVVGDGEQVVGDGGGGGRCGRVAGGSGGRVEERRRRGRV